MQGERPQADRQLPLGEETFLDHVGHFVRDPQAASGALARAGFAPTPVSVQVNPGADGSERLTGTGNVTAMLSQLPPTVFPLTAGVAAEMGAYGSDAHYAFVLDRFLAGLRATTADRF